MIDIAYAMAPGGGGEAGVGNPLTAFLPFILIFIVFYFLLIQPQRRKEQQHRQMLESLKKGDKIVTTGGIYGTVLSIKENKVKIEIAEGVEIDVLKSAIANRVK
ncbi:MAG TPA: preprotein translocase subunit YajC [Candidatus Omnitrophica bacterium]|nr:preprotein translocase subunit YajC [Candidatus Omnitrophota bacterium]